MNGYGQTECSPMISLVYPDAPKEKQRNTVGIPMEGVELAFMNPETKELLPPGEQGEILVKGYNVFNGYYKVPKERQPFDDNGYLHTGDLGYIDEDGYLVLSGRLKDIIIRKGENISPKAEDIAEGDELLGENVLIRPQEMGLIASAGHSEVEVYKKPRVKLLITGNELVEPSPELDKAKIINSNQFSIAALIRSAGAIVDIEHGADDFEAVKEAIDKATKEYDVVITTGGTAISKGDVVIEAVEELGEVLFHGVAMRPGKPVGAGIVNGTQIFMLSGQPVAAMGQFDIIARHYLFKMQGLDYSHKVINRVSKTKIPSSLGRTDYVRAVADDTGVHHVLNRGSGIIRSMVEANCYIIIDENHEGIEKGDEVDLIFFNDMAWPSL
jgi:molybdopterin molybdotransferase